MSLQPIECRGDHLAMGRAQGEAARGAILAGFAGLFGCEAWELARPRLLPGPLFVALAKRVAARRLKAPIERHYPEQAARMRGIGEGAGIDLRLLYLGLMTELTLAQVHWVAGACSAVAVAASRSASGEAAIAKNFDYPEPFRVGYIVRSNQPAPTGFRSIDVTVGPLAGCHSGVNEAGLALTYNYGYGQDRPRPGELAPITLACQRVLERCASVGEAAELLSRTARAGGAIVALADAAGEVAAVELTPNRCGVRAPEDGVLVVANHYETPEAAPVDIPRDARYGSRSVRSLVGVRVHESSERRAASLGRAVRAAGGPISQRDLEGLLRDHGGGAGGDGERRPHPDPLPGGEGESEERRPHPDPLPRREGGRGDDNTVCRHGAWFKTTCSLLLFPGERRLRLAFGPPCETAYVDLVLGGSPRAAAAATAATPTTA